MVRGITPHNDARGVATKKQYLCDVSPTTVALTPVLPYTAPAWQSFIVKPPGTLAADKFSHMRLGAAALGKIQTTKPSQIHPRRKPPPSEYHVLLSKDHATPLAAIHHLPATSYPHSSNTATLQAPPSSNSTTTRWQKYLKHVR